MKTRTTRSRRARIVSVATALTASALLFSSCASSSSDDAAPVEAGGQASELNKPGVHQVGPNEYVAVIFAYEGGFDPNEMHVPVGAKVTFRGKSTDPNFVHGFLIEGLPVEMELNGFEFTEASYTFTEPGEYNFACYIYCSGGHPAMLGKVIVE